VIYHVDVNFFMFLDVVDEMAELKLYILFAYGAEDFQPEFQDGFFLGVFSKLQFFDIAGQEGHKF
jgi:hypothetical protein